MRDRLLAAFIDLFAWLPFVLNRKAGAFLGWLLVVTRSRIYLTTQRNIAHCLPHLSDTEQKKLAYKSCIETGKVATESFWIWRRPADQVIGLIDKVEGQALVERALTEKKGVLLTGPHLGNWELITAWAGKTFDTAAMYRAPKISGLDKIIREGRAKCGASLLTGNVRNLKHILKHLRAGKVFVLLSDQEPGTGSGVYAPFFGKPAYTMTLVQKLQDRSNAKVLMFHIRRITKGFALTISDPQMDGTTASNEEYATLLNRNIQQLVETNLEQFQWGYKRFKTPYDGDYDFYSTNRK